MLVIEAMRQLASLTGKTDDWQWSSQFLSAGIAGALVGDSGLKRYAD